LALSCSRGLEGQQKGQQTGFDANVLEWNMSGKKCTVA